MDLKEAIMEIPNLIKTIKEKFLTEKLKFMDAKLEDGTIIEYEELVVGKEVMVINEDGTKVPLVDGTYKTVDGIQFEILQGVVSVVAEPSADAPVVEEEMSEPQTSTEKTNISKIVESVVKETVFSKEEINEKFSAIEKSSLEIIEKLKLENDSLKKEIETLKEFTKETFSVVEKIASQPTEKTSIEKKDGYKKQSKTLDLNEFRKKYFN